MNSPLDCRPTAALVITESEAADRCAPERADSLNPEPRPLNPTRDSLNPDLRSPNSSPGGRPRKLDDISRREICALISAGCGLREAGRYVGCTANTIRREAARNAGFEEALRQAYLAAELAPLNAMRRRHPLAGRRLAAGTHQPASLRQAKPQSTQAGATAETHPYFG